MLEVNAAGNFLKPRLKPWYHRPWDGEIDARLATGDEINSSRMFQDFLVVFVSGKTLHGQLLCVVFVASPLPQTNFM